MSRIVSSSYHNSRTNSAASIAIKGDMEKREIAVEVTIHDAAQHKYETLRFPADRFGEAIDAYEAAVGRFEKEDRSGYCGATSLPCSGCQPGPCGSRVDESPAGITS